MLALPLLLTLAVALALHAPRAIAHGGEEHAHGPESAVTATATARKVAALTERVEVVLEVPIADVHQPQRFRLFVSDPRTNEPVTGARVKLRLPDLKLDVEAAPSRVPGVHEAVLTPGLAGPRAAIVSIASPTHGDLVAFDSVQIGPGEDHEPSAWERLLGFFGLGHAEHEDHGAPAPATPGTSPETPAASVTKEAQFLFGLRIARAEPATLQGRTRLTGTIVAPPDASAQVIAPLTGRTLPIGNSVPRVGDRVRAGQPLVVLDGLLSSEERVSASAELANAEARIVAEGRELDLAERELARVDALPQVVSQRDREAAAARVDSARAGLQAARRSTALLRASLAGGPGSVARQELTSPIDGVITEAHVAVGEMAEAGHLLFHVIDPERLVVRADIPEREAASIAFPPGTRAKVVSRIATGLAGDATLRSSSRALDPVTRSVPVFFDLAPGSAFLDGMLVDVLVERGAPVTGFIVPVEAVTQLGAGRDVVFVKTASERFEPHDVTLGVTDGRSVELLSGIETGDLVVVSAAPRVRAALVSAGR